MKILTIFLLSLTLLYSGMPVSQIYALAPRGADKNLLNQMQDTAQRPKKAQKGVKNPSKNLDNSFKIGGVNTTASIRALKSINGVSITELEERMRPGQWSELGFLGEEESLIDVLVHDNDVVLRAGLTHQQLAEPLFKAMRGKKFKFNGRRFFSTAIDTYGKQGSPFDDGLEASANRTVYCEDTGMQITFEELVPELIHRYGFYEGPGSGYRLDPSAIIRMFFSDRIDLLPKELPPKTMSVEEIKTIIAPLPKGFHISAETSANGISHLKIHSPSQAWSYPLVVQFLGSEEYIALEHLDPVDYRPRYFLFMGTSRRMVAMEVGKPDFEMWKKAFFTPQAPLLGDLDHMDFLEIML